jgi:hypothetical protein
LLILVPLLSILPGMKGSDAFMALLDDMVSLAPVVDRTPPRVAIISVFHEGALPCAMTAPNETSNAIGDAAE